MQYLKSDGYFTLEVYLDSYRPCSECSLAMCDCGCCTERHRVTSATPGIGITGACWKFRVSGSSPDPLTQNLHFNGIPGDLNTHYFGEKMSPVWPKTLLGLPSTLMINAQLLTLAIIHSFITITERQALSWVIRGTQQG